MEIRLISAAIALLIGGCGGGSEDTGTTTPPIPPVPPPTVTQYTASASLVAGGKLTPASQKVDAGKSASFSVQADAGFVLDNISGCGGSLAELTYTTAAMTADCAITPAFISNAENAIRHQDHTLASANELIDFSTAKLASIDAVRKAQITQLYQGVGSSISWHPTHDSITFSSFMPENTFTLLPSNVDGSGASAVRGLVMAGEQQGLRYAAMGGNLFSVNTSAQTDVLLKNLIAWLTQGSDQRDGLSIITAQMPSRADSWYFPHNEGIRTWLATHYPNAHSINTANSCDYSALASCIDNQKPDLIVISDIDRDGLGYAGVQAAIAKAKAAGIPLLLSNYRREQSPMLAPLYLEMGLSTAGNYWSKLNADNLSVSTILAEDKAFGDVEKLLTNLREQR
ncbi:MAG: ImpA family metalloprotease, partial [Shewanella sp.]